MHQESCCFKTRTKQTSSQGLVGGRIAPNAVLEVVELSNRKPSCLVGCTARDGMQADVYTNPTGVTCAHGLTSHDVRSPWLPLHSNACTGYTRVLDRPSLIDRHVKLITCGGEGLRRRIGLYRGAITECSHGDISLVGIKFRPASS